MITFINLSVIFLLVINSFYIFQGDPSDGALILYGIQAGTGFMLILSNFIDWILK